ncbi:MAG: MBL fold metallo-hydrolase [Bacilli bacterium]|nr:MBL fold metallo-hydrolase [Bacilli bacterium]
MEIKLNAQSSIKITTDKIIYFDPYLIKEESHDADYILITHEHYDHFDIDSIKKVSNDKTIIIIPDSMAPKVLYQVNSNNVRGVKPNEEYTIEGLSLSTIPSYNTNKDFHKKSYNWVGYLVNIEDKIVYVAGDTDITDENKQVKCDIAFVPIGGTYTMDYKEAAELINTIKPEVVIPIHYHTIVGTREDANSFKELLDQGIECQIIME